MSSKWILGAAAALGLFLAGCGMQPGATVVKYEKDNGSRMTAAPADGAYALYGSGDTTPQVKYDLAKGDKIGFQENADGSVNAIAGNNLTTLKTSVLTRTYYWKQQKPPKSAASSKDDSN